MYLQNLAELLYKLQTWLTQIEKLFEGKWYFDLLNKYGVYEFHALVMRAHNELVQVRGCQSKQYSTFAWDYKPFYSAEKVHRMFEDPLHNCSRCRSTNRLQPTLKNIVFKRLGFKKYKDAYLLPVD